MKAKIVFFWGGHPARLSSWAARVAYPTEMYLQNWDDPGSWDDTTWEAI